MAAVNEAARLELENNQFAVPMPGGGAGLLGGVSRGAGSGDRETIRQQLGLDPKDEVSPEELSWIKKHHGYFGAAWKSVGTRSWGGSN